MCDLDVDGPDCYSDTWRKARKGHTCCACNEPIKAGEQYHYSSGVWDGTPESYKHCQRCWTMVQVLIQENYPDLVDLHLDCGESWDDLHGSTPEDLAELAFMLPKDFRSNIIRKRPNFMNGDACVHNTRIPIWRLEQHRRGGADDAGILRAYPVLIKSDLSAVWRYVEQNKDEIDVALRREKEKEDARFSAQRAF